MQREAGGIRTAQHMTADIHWQLKITQGVGDSLFALDMDIAREQVVVILYRYAAHKGQAGAGTPSVVLTDFSDFDLVSPWAHEAMTLALSNGLI